MVSIRFLGSGNAFSPQGRLHSLVLIDGDLLVDAPPTILPQLRRAEVPTDSISTLLITHWHADHTFGFPFLVLDRRFLSDRDGERTLNVHLVEGGEKRMRHLCEIGFPGTLDAVMDDRVVFHTANSGSIAAQSDWTFERFEVNHTPQTEPHGYDLRHTSGLRLLHCGDSGPSSEIEQRSSGADVVIIELGLPDWVDSEMHYKPSTLKSLAENNPETQFLATHLFTDSKGSGVATVEVLPDNVIEVADGDEFDWKNGQLVRVSN